MTAAPGEPVWMELTTTNPDQASSFYGALLGWSFDDQGDDYGHYQIIRQGGVDIGGAMVKQPEQAGQPDGFSIYLNTLDIDTTTDLVRQCGGRVIVEPMAIGDQGSMAFYLDPAGTAIGAWQGGTRPSMAKEGMFQSAWYELLTDQYEQALDFYPRVFGATAQPMSGDGGDGAFYSTLGPTERPFAGVCNATEWLSDEIPAHWRLYVNVPNVDESIETLTGLGGRVLDGPIDSPFGRVATVADDQGATFQLITPAR